MLRVFATWIIYHDRKNQEQRDIIDGEKYITWIQGTFSGTRKGWRPHSAKALSQRMVAQAWGSWLPCTITTTGRDGAHTWTVRLVRREEKLGKSRNLVCVTDLIVELAVANWELWPEEESELLVHDRLCPLFLRSLDLLETHVPEADAELTRGLVVLHGLLVVEDVPGAGLLGVARPQQGVGLGLGDDGGGHHGGAHVHVQLGAHQQPDGRTEPRVCLQNLKHKYYFYQLLCETIFLKIATTTNWQNWVSQLLLLQLPEAAVSLWQRNFWQADPATRWGHRRAPGGCSCWSPGWGCWVPHESSPVVGFAADWSRLFPPSPHTWGNTTLSCDTCLCLWVGYCVLCWLTDSFLWYNCNNCSNVMDQWGARLSCKGNAWKCHDYRATSSWRPSWAN